MKFQDIAEQVEGIPYTSPQKGKIFYEFVMDTKPEQCLELGFAHGVSSCYIAAALHELEKGHLTCVDLEMSKNFEPSIEVLLNRAGLDQLVTVVREKTGYNWFLKKKIEEQTVDGICNPFYDFTFIDGAKNWTIDGLAFFLVDKLLKQDGWILFDDYSWSYASQEARTGKTETDGVNHSELSQEEFEQPHIEAIFRNLVIQHPDYANFKILDNYLAFAQKTRSDIKTIKLNTSIDIKYKLTNALKKLIR